ncbi:MAG: hypothetical protein NUV46_04210 [Nanoarchaeota archaeon]|nr:hypothetical protein [Nanoarchaeota archaeon]
MKNVELWVTEIAGTFTVLDRWDFSFERKNPVINYFSDKCCQVNPSEIKQRIKHYITDKYKKCEPTIDVNIMYKNIITNIEKANLEII